MTRNISIRAITKQLELISKDSCEHILSVIPNEYDIHEWDLTIVGPNDSPYEGEIFHLIIRFTTEYPYKPPKINFKTNIKSTGKSDIGLESTKSYAERNINAPIDKNPIKETNLLLKF